jgi:hypothetical protein
MDGFALGPLLPNGAAEVELAFFRSFGLAENDQVVSPWQLSHQWCDNWIVSSRIQLGKS